MRKGGGRRRISQVVRRHVYRLHRGDRTVFGGGDPLLQRTEFGGKRRLVADRGRHPSEQCRHFGARLHKAENVVDKQQHVAVLLIAKILRHGQSRFGDPHTGAGRFVHLSENERGVFEHAGLAHFGPQIVAFAGAFADAGEDGVAATLARDVLNELLDEHRFADTGAAEQADLTAFGIRREQVDDLDAGLEDLHHRALLFKGRRCAVDAPQRCILDRIRLVDRLAQHVEQSAERLRTDRHANVVSGGDDLHVLGESFTGGEHDAAHQVAADMVRDLHYGGLAAEFGGQRLSQTGQRLGIKMNVHNRTGYLNDGTGIHDLRSPPNAEDGED